MKRIIKLTENDLSLIVKKVLQEQGSMFATAGTDIPGYRQDDIRNKPSQKVVTARLNINPKNLKLGDGGKNNPKQIEDVKKLQSELIRLGFLTLEKGPTGYFGNLTQKALDNFNKSGSKTGKTDTTGATKPVEKIKPVTGESGFILIWAYPEYEPKVDGKTKTAQFFGTLIRLSSGGGSEGTYGKQGHGGCVIVKSNGDAVCYEFGRYPGANKGYGKVRTLPLGRIGKISNGKLINAKEVAAAARRKTYPPGPTMDMTVAVVKLPDTNAATAYASVKEREYTAADFEIGEDANCGTFARDVANAGGVSVEKFCWPTPKSVVNSFKDKSDEFFEI